MPPNYLLPRHAMELNTQPMVNALNGYRQQQNRNQQFERQGEFRQQDLDWRQGQANQAQQNFLSNQEFRQGQADRSQGNADRSFGLQERTFDANQEHRKAQLGIQRAGAGTRSKELELRRRKLEFEIRKLKNGDPLKSAKVKLLQQLMGGQEAPAGAQQPQLLPQSNETTEQPPQVVPTGADGNPAQDPNLIPAQAADGTPGQQPAGSPMDNLTPAQRQAMALNLVSPGMGNALLANDKGEKFDKATKNKIEGKIFDTAEGMSRLDGIQKSFKPEFMTMGGGLKAGWIKMVDKIRAGGMKPTPEQTKYLTEYTQFKQDAWYNLNRYIKEITGAQMSEAEAARLMRSMPNPGTSFYDGDSPSEFKAKMDNSVRQLKLAAARYTYLRSARFKGKRMIGPGGKSNISIQQMRGIMNKRATEIYREMKKSNPGMDGNLIRAQADQATLREFGI